MADPKLFNVDIDITGSLDASVDITTPILYIGDLNTKLFKGDSDSLRIETSTGYIDIGSQNGSWAHIKANHSFYFNQAAYFDGNVFPYTTDNRTLGNGTYRWLNLYTVNINSTGVANLDIIEFANNEKADLTAGYQFGVDANDSSAPASLGTYWGTSPEGIYLKDATNTGTYTIYHTGHFSGTHIANWQTAYSWGDHAGLYVDGSGATNQVTFWSDTDTITGSTSLTWSSGVLSAGTGTTDNVIRSYYNDGTYAELRGYGLFMNRSTSYIRPTADNTHDLNIGAENYSWSAIILDYTNAILFKKEEVEVARFDNAGYFGLGVDPTVKFEINAGANSEILKIYNDVSSASGTTGYGFRIQGTAAREHTIYGSSSADYNLILSNGGTGEYNLSVNGELIVTNTPAGSTSDNILVIEPSGLVSTRTLSSIVAEGDTHIGNTNLTLTANRTLTMSGFSLNFTGGDFGVGRTPTTDFDFYRGSGNADMIIGADAGQAKLTLNSNITSGSYITTLEFKDGSSAISSIKVDDTTGLNIYDHTTSSNGINVATTGYVYITPAATYRTFIGTAAASENLVKLEVGGKLQVNKLDSSTSDNILVHTSGVVEQRALSSICLECERWHAEGGVGPDIYFDGGNVTIGTTTGDKPLTVYDSATSTVLIQSGTDNASLIVDSNTDGLGTEESAIFFQDNSVNKWEVYKNTANHFTIYDFTRTAIVFEIQDNGDMKLMENGGGVKIGSTASSCTLSVGGTLCVDTISHETTDVDKFLVSNGGTLKYRTGAELLSDIGAVTTTKPTAPTGLSIVESADKVAVSFNQVSGADRYEVWSSVGDETNYDLVAVVNENQVQATMTVNDTSYGVGNGTTVYYKVYAFNQSGQSTATSGNTTLASQTALEVSNLTVVAEEDFIHIKYDIPDDLRFDYVEVYVGTDPTSTVPKPVSPVYTGTNNSYKYSIASGDRGKYFQVWVDTIMN